MQQKRYMILTACLSIIVVAVALVFPLRSSVRVAMSTATAHFSNKPTASFPNIDWQELSAQQRKLLTLAKAEYAKHPVSYDGNVLAYTDGNKEAWCADFISWLMNQSGSPLTNPNSGSWRIPGVYTLQEYYQQQGRYEDSSSYQPKPGDVAIYIGKRLNVSSWQHTNMVVQVNGDTMTTVGGNQGGRVTLRQEPSHVGQNNLVGFGRL